MNGYTLAWIAWGLLTVGGFAVIETKALARKNRQDGRLDTLSAHLEKIVDAHPALKWGGLIVWGFFAAWIVEHLF